MSPNKAFLKDRERMIHISAPIISNPARVLDMLKNNGMSILPEFVVGPRTTFYKRRNEAKRMANSTCTSKGTKAFRLADPIFRCAKKVTP